MHLPQEVMLRIFSLLEPLERSVICMSVCRQWRDLARDGQLWRSLTLKSNFSHPMTAGFLQLPYIKDAVTTLLLPHVSSFPNVSLPKLQELHIGSLSSFEEFKKFPSLKHLHIAQCVSGDLVWQRSSEPKPFEFDIHVNHMHIDNVPYAAEWLMHVKQRVNVFRVNELTLYLHSFETSEAQALLERYPQMFSDVTKLAMELHLLEPAAVTNLQSVVIFPRTLTSLSLDNVSKDQAFKLLPTVCPNLVTFSLDMTTGQFTGVTPFLILKELELSMSRLLQREEVLEVLSVWKDLRVLKLYFGRITRTELEVIRQKNPQLEELFLNDHLKEKSCFQGKIITFSHLKRLLLNTNLFGSLPFIFAPVCVAFKTLPSYSDCEYRPLLATDPSCDLAVSFPVLEEVMLPRSHLKPELLNPLKATLRAVELVTGFRWTNSSELQILKDMASRCGGIQRLNFDVRVPTKDCQELARDVGRAVGTFGCLEECGISLGFEHTSEDVVKHSWHPDPFLTPVHETIHCYLKHCTSEVDPRQLDTRYYRSLPFAVSKTLGLQGYKRFDTSGPCDD